MKNEKTFYASGELDALESRFALRVAASLTESARELPRDITERLRVARERALETAQRAHKIQPVPSISRLANGSTATLAFGGPGSSWWHKLASVVPLVALIGGFLLIQHVHEKSQIAAASTLR